MTIRWTLALLIASSVCLIGCGAAGSSQAVPDKSAFQKKPVPPQWRGPGQPGGQASGPVPGGPPSGVKIPTGPVNGGQRMGPHSGKDE